MIMLKLLGSKLFLSMKIKLLIFCTLIIYSIGISGSPYNQKQVIYLSGKDNTNTKTWEFFCTGGRHANFWTKIEVPSCWEQQGFGNYEYGRNGYSYGPKYKYASEKGMYRYDFEVPASWKGKDINIVFDGSMTDTEVKLNGKVAGEIHRGAFYRFKYNITDKLNYGQINRLEVTVSKLSGDESVNRAERYGDYWNFGGIFRPVFLEAFPHEYIERVAIDGRADGSFRIDLFPKNLAAKRNIIAEITGADGKIAGSSSITASPGDSLLTLRFNVKNPLLWTSETPNLYKVKVTLENGSKELYSVTEKFGFRTIEVRHGDGIYLNGTKIKMKGINRHSFWPETGRTLSFDICLTDVKLIREMNMNAVRMSHYPPDVDFLDICDSLGLYVLDEIAGWQRAYDTPIGKKIVKETVIRDVNHPSVIFWDNGNEGGTNKELDKEFLIYDPSKRDVIHPHHRPGNDFNGIDCNHYEPYASTSKILQDSLIYMPTEFLHSQDDGGGGAGLFDYWELFWKADRGAGGFIWALLDEGVSRTDMNGYIDIDRVNAPDGVLGPHREKEGSFYAIKEIYSPVHILMKELPEGFDGKIEAENRFHFTDFDKCTFSAKLVTFNKPNEWLPGYNKVSEIRINSPTIKPGAKGNISVPMPAEWHDYDALVMTATDPFKNEIYSWTWQIRSNKKIIGQFITTKGDKSVDVADNDSTTTLKANGTSVTFRKKDGMISRVMYNNRSILFLSSGPLITTGNEKVAEFKHFADTDGYVVEIKYSGDLKSARWKMFNSGWLNLEYSFELNGNYQFAGISFSYPESYIIRAKWLGDGASRVWKNRMQGVTYNLREKVYNNSQTGAVPFFYPEFNGYFSDFTWMELSTAQGKILMATEDKNLFLRLYDFYGITGPKSYPELPPGDISFLDAIPPVGSKLATGLTTDASVYGPAGKPNELNGIKKHTLWFYFGIPDIK
jgi:hypothetical protein